MPVTFGLGGVPSNKPEKSGVIGKIDGKEVCYFPIPGVAITKPFIDKIAITYKISDKDLTAVVIQNLLQETEQEQGHFTNAAQFKSGAASYKASVNLNAPPGDAQVLIQAGPKKPGVTHGLRLEFNPRRLGKLGIAFLKSQLESLVLDGLNFAKIIAEGTVTKLDIAVDLVGIRVDQLDVRFSGGGKSQWYHSEKGQAETGYFGIKQKKTTKQNLPAPFVSYNKRKEIKDKGTEGGKQLYGGLSHTRVEFHATPGKPFPKLAKLPNPFNTISLAYPQAPNGIKPYAWAFFLDSCQRRGREAALDLLPARQLRKRYCKALDKAHDTFWKPDQIWACWIESLLKSEL